MFACKSLRNFIDKANKSKIYCFYTCIDCDLKVSKHIMGPFSDIEKNHKDYSQKLCSVVYIGNHDSDSSFRQKLDNLHQE